MLMQNGANINALTKDGFCPFENKHKKMILQLLNLLNHSNDMGLIRKFHKPHSLRLLMAISMKLLVENGADVNAQDLSGWTSLHYAIYQKNMCMHMVKTENIGQ